MIIACDRPSSSDGFLSPQLQGRAVFLPAADRCRESVHVGRVDAELLGEQRR